MVRPTHVLSVDWDYFFPDVSIEGGWDWSHAELGLYLSFIWTTRAGQLNITTKERALDVVVPRQDEADNFWQGIEVHYPQQVCIAESHKHIYDWLFDEDQGVEGAVVHSYDQHADLGYRDDPPLDCGSWAAHALWEGAIKELHLIYPEWRKDAPEGPEPIWKGSWRGDVHVEYEPIKVSEPYDFLFICRSGCWTPTWSDDSWMKFTAPWRDDLAAWDDGALQPRSPNREEAEAHAAVIALQWADMRGPDTVSPSGEK